jgi:hypothetical protein
LDENVKIKIEHEISRIEKQIYDAKPLLDLCKLKKPDFVEIKATAQILHSFYNGLESVAILFLKNNDIKLPNNIHWHKSLFEMLFGNNAKNVVIINSISKEQLEEYLLFRHYIRHYIRHSYSSELKWNEMESLVKNIEEIWQKIKEDFRNLLNNNLAAPW